MWWRSLLIVSILMLTAAVCTLAWEKRSDRPMPAAGAARSDMITVTNLYAGGVPPVELPDPKANTHEELSGYDVSEGKRLYAWYHCNTCHANGGGDIGPPLMDDKWIYGAAPRNIFASIVEGRPNGMPSYRGKLTDAEVWQLVAYVRSLSGQVPQPMRPGRNDDIAAKPPEQMAPTMPPVQSNNPISDNRANIQ